MEPVKHQSAIESEPQRPIPEVSLKKVFHVFFMAGAISFGGGVVAYLREYLVSEEKWLDDEQFLDALEISQTLPGLNAVNMSVLVGDKVAGTWGAIVAFLGMMLPGTVMIMTLGVLWAQQPHNPYLNYFLVGVAAAAVGLLSVVTMQVGRKQFAAPIDLVVVVATFATAGVLHWPLWKVLITVGVVAVLLKRPHPKRVLPKGSPHGREHLFSRLHIGLRH